MLFAAAMQGRCPGPWLDQALDELTKSQHPRLHELREANAKAPDSIHACTDITGFGLLGHLNEMVDASDTIQVELEIDKIPAYHGVHHLLEQGLTSTAAPANRKAWSSLEHSVKLKTSELKSGTAADTIHLELLIDPQTCGPLLVSCSQAAADILLSQGWTAIGTVRHR